MNIAFRTAPLAVEEFLAWERGQELRYEFDGREAIPMVGGTLRHKQTSFNVVALLQELLGNGLCRAFADGVKVVVAGRVRYPDAVVTCTPVDWDSDIVPSPVVVFEVLSPSTAHTDRTLRADEYHTTASIQHYVILEQEKAEAHLYTRKAEGWDYALVCKEGVLALPAIGISLTLAKCYAGLDIT